MKSSAPFSVRRAYLSLPEEAREALYEPMFDRLYQRVKWAWFGLIAVIFLMRALWGDLSIDSLKASALWAVAVGAATVVAFFAVRGSRCMVDHAEAQAFRRFLEQRDADSEVP